MLNLLSMHVDINIVALYLRESLKKLIKTVNRQKDVLKKNGITVDGIKHTLKFKGMTKIMIVHNNNDCS